MIDIFVQIISDLTSHGYIKAIEISLSIITLLVLSWTLSWVIKYTKSTERLQKASEEQTLIMTEQQRLSLLPFLVHRPSYDNENSWHNKITLKNVGNGNAFGIYIADIENTSGMGIGYFDFNTIPNLGPGEEKEIDVTYHKSENGGTISVSNKESRERISDLIMSKDFIYEMHFEFSDINGNKYKQENRVNNAVVLPGKVCRLEN